jgi:hypothetical protein
LPEFYPALVAKIRARLIPDPERPGCLLWPGGRGSKGHGRVKHGGKLYGPHRVLLEHKLGRVLPRHLEACHSCDNPPCCNEAHLWEGTRADNNQDAIAKGRMGAVRLTEAGRARLAAHGRSRALARCHECARFLVSGDCPRCGGKADARAASLNEIRAWLEAKRSVEAQPRSTLPTARPGQDRLP